MAEYIKNPLSGKLRGVTYEDGKIIDVHIRDTDDVVKVFVPVRHGRWIRRKSCHTQTGFIDKCSVCQKDLVHLGYKTNFCPNCGAKMDEEANNER